LPTRNRPLVISVIRAAAGWYLSKVEYICILILEKLLRLYHRLDPAIYSERRRVERVREGAPLKAGGKFIVLVLFARHGLPAFTRSLVEAVMRSDLNLAVVSNLPVDEPLAAELLAASCLLIERKNIGRDFGAYQDAINIVTARHPDMQRLVIANDSVAYLPDGLDDLLRGLDGNADWIGVSEVYDHHYHIASFLMSFGPRVIRHRAFREFWRTYRPIGTRRWAILKGEGGLTDVLLRAGFRPQVLFRAVQLREPLTDTELASLQPLLPPAVFATLTGQAEPDLPELTRRLFSIGKSRAGERRLPDRVIDEVMARNQMHAGGFLFRRFLGLPIVKRDIRYRGVYPLPQIAAALADVEPALRSEILADFERRGDGADTPLLLKPLYHHGII
jgi:hypothetical protein